MHDINEALSREVLSLLPPSPPPNLSIPLVKLVDTLDARFCETGNIDDIKKQLHCSKKCTYWILPKLSNPVCSIVLPMHIDCDSSRCCWHWQGVFLTYRGSMATTIPPSRVIQLTKQPHQYMPDSTWQQKIRIWMRRLHCTMKHSTCVVIPIPSYQLSLALQIRFDHTNTLEDLNKAISLYWEALGLRPAPDPGQFSELTLHLPLIRIQSLWSRVGTWLAKLDAKYLMFPNLMQYQHGTSSHAFQILIHTTTLTFVLVSILFSW